MYKVTLSLPIYNVENYVEKSLLSALNQTFDSIEYIIVDDCGSDTSMNIVREIIKSHPRRKDVRIISHPYNIGLGAARNTAIANAHGKYIFFMDSDDEITLDCIAVLYDSMIKNPVDFVSGSVEVLNIEGKSINIISNDNHVFISGRFKLAQKFYSNQVNMSIAIWNKLYSLDFLNNNNIRCISNHSMDDGTFTPLVIFFAKSCTILANITIHYYQRSNSLEFNRHRNFNYKNANEHSEIFRTWKVLLLEYRNTNVYGYYFYYILTYILYTIVLLLKSKDICKIDKVKYREEWCSFDMSIIKMLKTCPFSLKYFCFLLILKIPICLNLYYFYMSKIKKIV